MKIFNFISKAGKVLEKENKRTEHLIIKSIDRRKKTIEDGRKRLANLKDIPHTPERSDAR